MKKEIYFKELTHEFVGAGKSKICRLKTQGRDDAAIQVQKYAVGRLAFSLGKLSFFFFFF